MAEISHKQVLEWTVYAQQRRMNEMVTGPWWELIPEDQKPLARAWAVQHEPRFKDYDG